MLAYYAVLMFVTGSRKIIFPFSDNQTLTLPFVSRRSSREKMIKYKLIKFLLNGTDLLLQLFEIVCFEDKDENFRSALSYQSCYSTGAIKHISVYKPVIECLHQSLVEGPRDTPAFS